MSVEDQIAYFAEWTAWLDRGERFVTLRVFENPVSLRRPTGGGKEAKAWLHANNAKIKTFVRGMATVVPPECLVEVNRINAEKLFGVPAQTFDELEKAAEWIIKIFKEDEIYHIDRQIIVDHTLDLQLSRGGGCTVSR